MRASRVLSLGVLAIGIVALPMAALASHGKVGLWNVTIKVSMANMPQIPPDQLAKMQAMGVHVPNGSTMSVQHCMTAAEVASDKPPQMQHNDNCAMQNVSFSRGMFTADMVCTGKDMQGTGHVTATYDSDTHYTGHMAFNGTAHGHSANISNSVEGTWMSADCGTVGH
jgi:hypothetical protein